MDGVERKGKRERGWRWGSNCGRFGGRLGSICGEVESLRDLKIGER